MSTTRELKLAIGSILIQAGVGIPKAGKYCENDSEKGGGRRLKKAGNRIIAVSKDEVIAPVRPTGVRGSQRPRTAPIARSNHPTAEVDVTYLRRRHSGPLTVTGHTTATVLVDEDSRTETKSASTPIRTPTEQPSTTNPITNIPSVKHYAVRYRYMPSESRWEECHVFATLSPRVVDCELQHLNVPYLINRSYYTCREDEIMSAKTRVCRLTVLHKDKCHGGQRSFTPKECYYSDVAGYSVAKEIGDVWNRETTQHPLHFTEPSLLNINGSFFRNDSPTTGGRTTGVLAEDYCGYKVYYKQKLLPPVSFQGGPGFSQLMEAFSHFSWHHSRHKLLVLVSKFHNSTPLEVVLLLSDANIDIPTCPSWLSKWYNNTMFGGREGVAKFFASHQCGQICRNMRLSSVPFVAAKIIGIAVENKHPRL